MHGGDMVAEVLKAQAVEFLFTLVGGHISPILVGAKARGIRVVDTRHEVNAVFAADAVARLTGRPGVAAVTAGPGVTNSVTALKNAQMAQSPVVLLGGAAPTILQGRGALQDIDQMSLVASLVKWSARVSRVKDIIPTVEEAFRQAQSDTPGPVFVELPIDLLYEEATVKELYGVKGSSKTLAQRATNLYLQRHVKRMFAGAEKAKAGPVIVVPPLEPKERLVEKAAEALAKAERPVILVGSQATLDTPSIAPMIAALERIGAPVYLSGMARGLLGRDHPLQMRHKRREALREADVVILAGVPADFRLDYGRHIGHKALYVSANRSETDLTKNRKPDIAILGDPAVFLARLDEALPAAERWADWRASLRARDDARNAEIGEQTEAAIEGVNPLSLLRQIDGALDDNAIVVADGGDFVGTASYIVRPTGPLAWLDPGAFGTLGVGAGFALGAKLVHPDAEVWILYGDGSAGYSLSEFDTFVRHGIPVIAVVGNDAAWMQIAREQVELLGDDVATVLAHTNYHCVVEGFGAAGIQVDAAEQIPEALAQAKAAAAGGKPVLVNAILGRTDFRKGSISM
ncbi:MAG: thiamine pyrophosphate-binding protein [Anaerolineae bacterium]